MRSNFSKNEHQMIRVIAKEGLTVAIFNVRHNQLH
jgi:hypothetical protein